MQYYFKTNSKFYNISIQANLFGQSDIICSWGALSSNQSGYKIIPCSDANDLQLQLKQLIKRRESRGYCDTKSLQEAVMTLGYQWTSPPILGESTSLNKERDEQNMKYILLRTESGARVTDSPDSHISG